MIRTFILLVISVMLLAQAAQASKGPSGKTASAKHFQGQGVWIYNEILLSGNDYEAYVQMAKDKGMKYVIVKAYDGKEWGTKNRQRKFRSQLSEPMVKAFHQAGIKCYAYGSTYLHPTSGIDEATRHAINTLHKTSVDGLVVDDVFAYGKDQAHAKKLFSAVHRHLKTCKKCRNKPLALSTFPHVDKKYYPWKIPFQYVDYYLPQLYWADMNSTPVGIVDKFNHNWSTYLKQNPGVRCKVIPVAPTSGKTQVTPAQIDQFIKRCQGYGYSDLAFYRWDKTSVAEWRVIQRSTKKKT